MKVYFNFSGRSSNQIVDNCRTIYKLLISKGFTHTFDCFENYLKGAEDINNPKIAEALYQKCVKAIALSDIVILELSTNSFTQGFILQKSLELNKPVIALHTKASLSIFAKGISNKLCQLAEYSSLNISDILNDCICTAKDNLESRFNFYLPPTISNYLKWISKKHHKSKSAFVRDMLKDMMSKDFEYLN